MVREIIMLYGKYCLNAKTMMPVIKKMDKKKYNFIIQEYWENEKGKKIAEKYRKIIKNFGGSPIFIDVEKKKSVYAPDIESVMEFLEGPEWWNN